MWGMKSPLWCSAYCVMHKSARCVEHAARFVLENGSHMDNFIPGLRLSAEFYREAVAPILTVEFPDVPYSAALIGSGSEVLGFDTEMSSDHHWGPRVMIFLCEADHARYHEAMRHTFSQQLPGTFHGYPTNFTPPNPEDSGVQLLQAADGGPINHRVDILTVHGFWLDYLGFDIDHAIEVVDWLTFPEQKLRSLLAGAVFHNDIGLQAVRDRFTYYPHDVWLYLLAAGWARIGQEEHLMGRAGYVGDEMGSALIGARLVRDIMRLCFLMERQYAPYPKWLGTAFQQLESAATLSPILQQALSATTWQERQDHLAAAFEVIAARHNALNITEPLPEKATSFFGRPFRVIGGEKFSRALCTCITDPVVRRLSELPLIGSIDLISDNTDLLSDPRWRLALCNLWL
jgi:hypothetical protein